MALSMCCVSHAGITSAGLGGAIRVLKTSSLIPRHLMLEVSEQVLKQNIKKGENYIHSITRVKDGYHVRSGIYHGKEAPGTLTSIRESYFSFSDFIVHASSDGKILLTAQNLHGVEFAGEFVFKTAPRSSQLGGSLLELKVTSFRDARLGYGLNTAERGVFRTAQTIQIQNIDLGVLTVSRGRIYSVDGYYKLLDEKEIADAVRSLFR